jgi:hypothetical protein
MATTSQFESHISVANLRSRRWWTLGVGVGRGPRAVTVALACCVLAVDCGGNAPSAPTRPSVTGTPAVPTSPVPQPGGRIDSIAALLDSCPTSDSAYETIRRDLHLRRNGQAIADVPCREPMSSLSITEYTDELIALQGFRVMYHMDAGLSGHLPWATGTVYEWFASKVGGVNIDDGATFNSCCSTIAGRRHITLIRGDDFNRSADRSWEGLSQNISLYLHEARHIDGFPHVSCCGLSNGCDQTYDERQLSPYGLSYWVNRAWAQGTIEVGATSTALALQRNAANDLRRRFCENMPPQL